MNLDKQIKDILKFSDFMGNVVGDQSKINLYVDLLVEEMDELRLAIRANDRKEIRDGIADVLVIAVQLAHLDGMEDIFSEYSYAFNCRDRGLTDMAIFGHMSSELSRIATYNSYEYHVSGFSLNMLSLCSHFSLALSINQAADLDAVMKSNFSKFCKTNYDAVNSSNAWLKKGINNETRETGDPECPYSIHAAEDTKQFPKGKLLKPLGFHEPVFADEAEAT